MKTHRFALAPLAGSTTALALAVAFAIAPARPRPALASSHAEAPAIADDPAMDNTDVWAWQDNVGGTPTITIVTAWNGVSTPSGGPNYKKWVPYPQGVYEIHIDNNGDGVEDLTYQFQFSNVDNAAQTFLRVTSPPTYGPLALGAGDPVQKFRQTYSVAKISGLRRSNTNPTLSSNGAAATVFPVAPPNTGPKLTFGRAGAVNASIAGTYAITTNTSNVTVNAVGGLTTALAANQPIQFGSQAGVTYLVSSAVSAGATTFAVTTVYTGPTTASTTVLVQGPSVPTAGNDYEAKIAQPAIQTLTSGEKIFVGPRADAFFVDLGPTFDRLKIRTFGQQPGIANAGTRGPDVGQYGGAYNTLAGKNVEVIAIQIPIANLGGSFNLPAPFNTAHVGVWASSSRSKIRVLPVNNGSRAVLTGQPKDSREAGTGSWVQVSRLGNPLVNELFIPFDRKDQWNADAPANDATHWAQYFSNPEVPGILNAVYGVPVPPAPRNDLQFLFAPDTLKVSVGLASALTASSAAFVGGPGIALDGRTLGDDVVDIYLKAAAGILVIPASGGGFGAASVFGMPAFNPPSAAQLFPTSNTTGLAAGTTINSLLGDGVDYGTDGSGAGFKVTPSTFPYMPTPWDGQEVNNDYFQSPRHN